MPTAGLVRLPSPEVPVRRCRTGSLRPAPLPSGGAAVGPEKADPGAAALQ